MTKYHDRCWYSDQLVCIFYQSAAWRCWDLWKTRRGVHSLFERRHRRRTWDRLWRFGEGFIFDVKESSFSVFELWHWFVTRDGPVLFIFSLGGEGGKRKGFQVFLFLRSNFFPKTLSLDPRSFWESIFLQTVWEHEHLLQLVIELFLSVAVVPTSDCMRFPWPSQGFMGLPPQLEFYCLPDIQKVVNEFT